MVISFFFKSVNWIKRMYRYRNTEEPVYGESQLKLCRKCQMKNSNKMINKICKKD